MVGVEEARRIIAAVPRHTGTEQIPLDACLHRILGADITADQDIPAFDRVMMDGIAIAFHNGPHTRYIHQAIQRAGQPPLTLLSAGHAIEIMTGAACPEGADTVVPYEKCRRIGDEWVPEASAIVRGANIHPQGKDYLRGAVLLTAGTRLGPAASGVLASTGHTSALVLRRPGIKIFSTGDELVDAGSVPLAHQVRRSNAVSLKALLASEGFAAEDAHLPDDAAAMAGPLKEALDAGGVILVSGGVSRGKFDLIPEVLERLGVERHFHSVRQKPGKPFWFGRSTSSVVFAFPGNPVSTYVCAFIYLLPWLRRSPSLMPSLFAPLDRDYNKPAGMTHFVPAVFTPEGRLSLRPGNGSGDFTNLAHAEALVELPEEHTACRAGEPFRFILLRG